MCTLDTYALGLDLGSSSVKAALVSLTDGSVVASAQHPADELPIDRPQPSWAEQSPSMWWDAAVTATRQAIQQLESRTDTTDAGQRVRAVGIAYQMHGLVCLDAENKVLRPSIIWCDGRAVANGQTMANAWGQGLWPKHCLNQPGNFTLSKWHWVLANEPDLAQRIAKVCLPGDWLAAQLTCDVRTTASGLSEMIAWDFALHAPAVEALAACGLDASCLPELVPTFGSQGTVTQAAAQALGIAADVPVAYRAGDQPNNAWSLGVLEPGQVATTAGTSGVVYGVSETQTSDVANNASQAFNTFAHVNHRADAARLGMLLCVNGTGIAQAWIKNLLQAPNHDAINSLAADAPIGADGLVFLPFGNGPERMLGLKDLSASFHGLSFGQHGPAHMARAVQEGIAFALAFGMGKMQQAGMPLKRLVAGQANLFLSPLFRQTLANATGCGIDLCNTDGAAGAGRGAGLGIGAFASAKAALQSLAVMESIEPSSKDQAATQNAFDRWQSALDKTLAG